MVGEWILIPSLSTREAAIQSLQVSNLQILNTHFPARYYKKAFQSQSENFLLVHNFEPIFLSTFFFFLYNTLLNF